MRVPNRRVPDARHLLPQIQQSHTSALRARFGNPGRSSVQIHTNCPFDNDFLTWLVAACDFEKNSYWQFFGGYFIFAPK